MSKEAHERGGDEHEGLGRQRVQPDQLNEQGERDSIHSNGQNVDTDKLHEIRPNMTRDFKYNPAVQHERQGDGNRVGKSETQKIAEWNVCKEKQVEDYKQ